MYFSGLYSVVKTHIVAVQVQDCDGDEAVDEVGHLADEVPAQVQLVHLIQLLDALWNCGDLFEAEVEPALPVQRQLHTILGHLQSQGLAFGLLGLRLVDHVSVRTKNSEGLGT